MRKRLNQLFSFRLVIAVLCGMSVLSTTSLSTQESASRTTPKAVQRGPEAHAAVSQPLSQSAYPFTARPTAPKSANWFSRHKTLSAFLIGSTAGSILGLTLARGPECHDYKYGQTGEHMPCPKEK